MTLFKYFRVPWQELSVSVQARTRITKSPGSILNKSDHTTYLIEFMVNGITHQLAVSYSLWENIKIDNQVVVKYRYSRDGDNPKIQCRELKTP